MTRSLQDLNTFGPLKFFFIHGLQLIFYISQSIYTSQHPFTQNQPITSNTYMPTTATPTTSNDVLHSLVLRDHRLISKPKNKIQCNKTLQKDFNERGYPGDLVKEQFAGAQSPQKQPKIITEFHRVFYS